ncbi:hypothetical protein NQ103_09195 [Vibrio parahaemolyticus]|nr:hypothetical protein [Vibrio parahaemolyticus]
MPFEVLEAPPPPPLLLLLLLLRLLAPELLLLLLAEEADEVGVVSDEEPEVVESVAEEAEEPVSEASEAEVLEPPPGSASLAEEMRPPTPPVALEMMPPMALVMSWATTVAARPRKTVENFMMIMCVFGWFDVTCMKGRKTIV